MTMLDLLSFHARICQTAGGFLIQDHKVLLVLHKKLNIWLAPGGHLEAGELPHQAAEREVWEETGVHVKAISPLPVIASTTNNYFPAPFVTNLHWVCKDNYDARVASNQPDQPHTTAIWPKGCEQHFNYLYMVEATEPIAIPRDPNESDDIGWFGLDDLATLNTSDNIRAEIKLALQLSKV